MLEIYKNGKKPLSGTVLYEVSYVVNVSNSGGMAGEKDRENHIQPLVQLTSTKTERSSQAVNYKTLELIYLLNHSY